MRILISYHYFRSTDLDRLFGEQWGDPKPEVFADSGAFSALTQGADVRVDEYAAWLKRWGHWFTVTANLDVIGDGAAAAEGTARNQAILEDAGLRPLPVFHAGEPWDALDRYLADGYPYIALGGLVGRAVATIMPWLVQCFQRAAGRAVFHGFGLTSWEPLAALPWYSVDSSSWGSSFRYGQLRLFDPRRGRWVVGAIGDRASLFRPPVAALIREHGFDPMTFADREQYTRDAACKLSAVAWWRAEQWLRGRHGPVGIPGGDGPRGLRWYCADGSADGRNLLDAARGLRMYLADTSTTNLLNTLHPQGLNLYLATGLSELIPAWQVHKERGEKP
jgi:hypothetical protein